MDTATKNAMGVDSQGRLHGSVATKLLLAEMDEHGARWTRPSGIPTNTPGAKVGERVNVWDAADAAVEATTDPDVKDAALRNLLALHEVALEEETPMVAMRNVRVSDYVRLHGCTCYVRQVLDDAPSRSRYRSITLKVELHKPGGTRQTFAYSADVRIPLLAREVAS